MLSTGRLAEDPPEAAHSGMLNAADLFDPEVLADLTGSGDESRSATPRGAAPAQDDYPSFAEEADDGYQEDERDSRPAPPRPTSSRPIAAPLFSLTALPTTDPQQSVPPPPPPPPFPSRSHPPDAVMAPPDEQAWRLQKGYRVASGSAPLGAPPGRPSMPAPGMVPAGAYPMPAAPGFKTGAQPRKNRPFFRTMGGLSTLLLVLVILGSAILFGATRYFQFQAQHQPPPQATAGPLPTVAPRAGYTIFPDQKLDISLQYANSWHEKADTDSSDVTYQGDLFYAGMDPGFDTGFEVGSSPQYASLSPLQMDDYVLANPFPLSGIASIQTYTSASSTIHISNLNWTAEDADIVLNNGITLRMTCLAIIHQGQGYVIFYFSQQEVFSDDYAQYFQPMLLSFRFLNG